MRKQIINLSSAELAQRLVMAKPVKPSNVTYFILPNDRGANIMIYVYTGVNCH